MAMNLLMLLPVLLPLITGLLLGSLNLDGEQRKKYVGVVVLVNFLVVVFISTQQTGDINLISITDALTLRLMSDGFGKLFSVLAAGIWILVTFYAFEYMSHEGNEDRFFTFFLMTLGTLMGIGSSGNLLTFYLFYEMMTFITYPLVTHNNSSEALSAGNKYIIYSLIGAQLSLITMMAIFYFGTTHNFIAGGVLDPAMVGDNQNVLLTLYVLTVIGFGAKAGMFPLHAWLPIAHPVAPAPGSGVLSGVITKAGVLGIIRMTYFIFGADFIRGTWAHYTVICLALLTIFVGSMLAFGAKQLKVRLAYSSVSQVSYVLLGVLTLNSIGLTGGLLHMVFHAIIKNALFLSVGAVMYKAHKYYVDEIVGIGKFMPITMWCFTLASLALIGIPPASGFVSKWFLGTGSLEMPLQFLGIAAVVILIISAILTAGYLLSITASAFFPGKEFDYGSVKSLDPTRYMTIPLIILAALSILFGLFPNPLINLFSSIVNTVF